jgi:hypothetical protein
MNRERLQELTRAEHIRDDAYSLDGGLPFERYVLSITEGGWAVYYSERGERVGLREFQTEDDACSYLLDVLLRDQTTREDYSNP